MRRAECVLFIVTIVAFSRLAAAQSITIVDGSITTRNPGSSISVNVQRGGSGSRTDWVSLAQVGSADTSSISWKYLSNTTSPPASALSSATLTFTLPFTLGNYELRFYANDGYTRLATSGTLTTAWPASTVTANQVSSPGTVSGLPGHTVSVTVTNGPATTTDWAELTTVGAADSATPFSWQYLNGTTTAPATGVSSATLTFTLPNAIGSYEIRFFAHGTYTKLGTGPTMTTYQPLRVNGSPYIPITLSSPQTVNVSVSDAVTTVRSWIGLFQVGGGNVIDWRYLNNSGYPPSSPIANATVTLNVPSTSANYEFRIFYDDGYLKQIGGSATVGTIDHASPTQRYGVHLGTGAWSDAVAASVNSLGAGLVRFSCNWDQDEPTQGNVTFACSDAAITGATGQGLRVLMTINCTPGWANGNAGCHTLPSNLSDWTYYVQQFAAHYAGKNVVLGVFNEPNLSVPDTHEVSTTDYCTLFRTASAARTSSTNPTLPLAAPETSAAGVTTGWVATAMYCINYYSAFGASDIVTAHWYPDDDNGWNQPLSSYPDNVHTVAGGGSNLWITEIGAHCDCSNGGHRQSMETAQFIYQLVAMSKSRPWLNGVIYYAGVPDSATDLSLFNSSLSDPRPAWFAYQAVIQSVSGKVVAATLQPGQALAPNASLSTGGLYTLTYRSDGDLALYFTNSFGTTQQWHTATTSTAGQAVMQTDGNFVVLDASNGHQWDSQTGSVGNANSYLVLQGNGMLSIFSPTGALLWSVNEPSY